MKVEQPSKSLVRIVANRKGLLSLAAQLETFANSEELSVLYENTSGDLEDGSLWLEIQKSVCSGKATYAQTLHFSQLQKWKRVHLNCQVSADQPDIRKENVHLYSAPAEKRYRFLLHSIQKGKPCWMLSNGGEVLTIDTEDAEALLIWPEYVYAEAFCKQLKTAMVPVTLSNSSLCDLAQKALSNDKAGFLAFSTVQNGYLVSTDKFLKDLGLLKP